MAHYQAVRPWCEIMLGQYMPLAVSGKTLGISLLFPMEKLFERYVEVKLRNKLPAPYSLTRQAASRSLCKHKDNDMFELRPDMLVKDGQKTILVLDTKWKLIAADIGDTKYGLSQGDFYQMFAYGQKYLEGTGEMLLIYPRTESFPDTLLPFDFSNDLRLWVAPFDLDKDELHWPSEWDETHFAKMRHYG